MEWKDGWSGRMDGWSRCDGCDGFDGCEKCDEWWMDVVMDGGWM